ncbi:hypothetical protein EYF80_064151 [Liparis tanakae]|uniref:Uncharacterized protein n=1 Tax=Liparis tanakae TaxID=230148 RepID=A0A4Z2EA66_9TELE|nr:hypothetical protein EYF80_064151 [Liparis tanakae]
MSRAAFKQRGNTDTRSVWGNTPTDGECKCPVGLMPTTFDLTSSRLSHCAIRPSSLSVRLLFSRHSRSLRVLCCSICCWMSLSMLWKWPLTSALWAASSWRRRRPSSCRGRQRDSGL